MRTTIRLDDQLLREAKSYAARTGRTLTAVIEDSLRAALQRADAQAAGEESLPVFRPQGARGVRNGVDLADSSSLLELMEGRER
jgi:hypothetical protein